MWKSSVPKNWRSLCKDGIISAERFTQGNTLHFLLETQKYIHSIRKPPLICNSPSKPSPIPTATLKTEPTEPISMRKEEQKVGYSVKYFGEIEGGIGVRTRKIALQRPETSGPKLATSLSLESVTRYSAKGFSTPPSRLSPRMHIRIPRHVLDHSSPKSSHPSTAIGTSRVNLLLPQTESS